MADLMFGHYIFSLLYTDCPCYLYCAINEPQIDSNNNKFIFIMIIFMRYIAYSIHRNSINISTINKTIKLAYFTCSKKLLLRDISQVFFLENCIYTTLNLLLLYAAK